MPRSLIGIKAIHIARYGDDNGPYARIAVRVTLAGGQEVDIFDASVDASFSHHISAEEIAAFAKTQRVSR